MSTCSTAVVRVTYWAPSSSIEASSIVTFSWSGARAFSLLSIALSRFMMVKSMASVVVLEPSWRWYSWRWKQT
jgi:hypothetical protein